MKEIPILFLKDDVVLIEMYQNYFKAKGYRCVIIRGGEEDLERALSEGPSLITFKTDTLSNGAHSDSSLVIIFTYQSHFRYKKRPKIKSAAISSEVFMEIESLLDPSS